MKPLFQRGRKFALIGMAAGILGLGPMAAQAQTKVVVGYQQIVGPFVSAIADGSFDKAAQEAGYKIDWRQFSSAGDISTAFASRDVPIGILGSTGITAAVTRGVNIELFWILDNIGKSEALVARNGSGVSKPQDLVGKKVGVPFVSTAHFHLLVGMDKVWNIDPRKVNILNMQPPQIVAAWQRGDLDAAYVWPPALTEIQKTGTTIADSEQIGKASVPTFDGIVADRDWAAKNPKFMAAFTKVLAKSYKDYNDNVGKLAPDSQGVKGISKMIGGKPDDIVSALQLLLFPNVAEQASGTWLGGGKDGGAVKALTESAKFLKEQRQIDKPLDDYSKFVNASYAEAAAK
ncbi:taurine ABC transporter substrate-binding protein [Parapusillimonas granuli]|uniref:Taurine ABC transporter substrate-binding protein n=1 Tax=Parapusillimonas granuli TaxID=380911 RepID=A0A853FZW2_9BURK|nr:taurine ABC transporter substrate-binding protein [Parapusillimonas granuli]MBB5216845.1 taurine transport system substrate-binding protein [Parapusillimonas granuli]MEB2401491.1 taurine ABC transporter substrate-binding protein [Alcaligenaceae bacterium]NYT51644.1 taurine ABC transporter substrate-binding protein [Parapusillimonas granuli]